jgi:hypothetical protein
LLLLLITSPPIPARQYPHTNTQNISSVSDLYLQASTYFSSVSTVHGKRRLLLHVF